MKNRNIPYYVAALMLAAGVSTSFVSCVDTDEPETVTKLRQEAINKLAADTDLQKALAEVERAKVKYNEALAAVQNADAAQKNADAKTVELQNQITEAGLDNAKQAEIQKQLALLETEKQNYEKNRLNAAKEAAKYESEYQAALKDAQDRLAEIAGQKNKALTEALSAYVDAQKEVLEKKVAYNDALKAAEVGGDAVIGSHSEYEVAEIPTNVLLKDANGNQVYESVTFDGEPQIAYYDSYYDPIEGDDVYYPVYKTDDEGNIVYKKVTYQVPAYVKDKQVLWKNVTDTKHTDGTVDYETEVSLKQVALDLATAEKADIEAVFADPDFEKWSTQYSDAEKAIDALESELAEIDIKAEENKEAINVKNQEVSDKETAIKQEYTDWATATETYTIDCSESLKKEVFGEADDATEIVKNATKLKYYNGKVTLQYFRDGEYRTQIQNQDLPTALANVLTVLAAYENDNQANNLKETYQTAKKNFEESTYKKDVEGDSKAEAGSDAAKGMKTIYLNAWSAYNGAGADKKEEMKGKYEAAADNLFGRLTDSKGGYLNGQMPDEKEVLDDYEHWSTYGSYLNLQQVMKQAEAKYNNFVAASGIYNTIETKQKAAADLLLAKSAEKDDKLTKDEDYLKLQSELKALNDEKTQITSSQKLKKAELQKNKAVQTAINTACGLFDDDDENIAEFGLDNFGDVAKIKDVLIAVAKADVAKAQAELDAAKSALENHNKGLSESQIAVEYAKKQVEIAEEKEKLAKEKYEEVKKAYGITE